MTDDMSRCAKKLESLQSSLGRRKRQRPGTEGQPIIKGALDDDDDDNYYDNYHDDGLPPSGQF